MVRTERWKYVERSTGPEELYDLDDDPGERTNLARDPGHAGRRRELRDALREWFAAHTHAVLDAYRRPVSGRGQLRPAGEGRSDDETYYSRGRDASRASGAKCIGP
jgi:choline-sulfatase